MGKSSDFLITKAMLSLAAPTLLSKPLPGAMPKPMQKKTTYPSWQFNITVDFKPVAEFTLEEL